MTRCPPVFTILVAFTLVLSGWKAGRATAGTIHHQYDELNRIVQTHYGDGSRVTYRYDQSDNVIEMTRGQPPADMNLELTACHISGPVSVNEKSAAHFIATAVFSQNGIPVLELDVTTTATWSLNSVYAELDTGRPGRLITRPVAADTALIMRAEYTHNGTKRYDEKSVTIKDTGSATLIPSQSSWHAGTVSIGEASPTRTIGFTAHGIRDLPMGAAHLNGSGGFEIIADGCSYNTLPAGDSQGCTITVKLHTASMGAHAAALVINSKHADNAPLTISLSGQVSSGSALSVAATGNGFGRITCNQGRIDCGTACVSPYEQGREIALSAVAQPGSAFMGWTGGTCSGLTNPCTFIFTGAAHVDATFTTPPPSGAPVADFTCGPLKGKVGAPADRLACTDASQNNPHTWLWHFGDGSSAQDQNPHHLYTTPGAFTLSMSATNAAGSTSMEKRAYVMRFLDPATCPTASQAARIVNAGTYTSVQAAYNAAASGGVIEALALDQGQSLSCNQDKKVTLNGAYDCGYTQAVLMGIRVNRLTLSAGATVLTGAGVLIAH